MQNASNNQTAYIWRMPVYGGVFLLLMFAVEMPAWGQTVAFIDSFNGPANAFLLKDDKGDEDRFYVGVPLEKGYVITFRDSRARSVTLVLDSERKKITSRDSPYKIEPLSSSGWCGGWCNTVFGWLQDISVNAYRRTWTNIRGIRTCNDGNNNDNQNCNHFEEESFSIPMLKKDAKLLPGKRSQLHIGWSDGSSSTSSDTLYTVALYKNGSNEPVLRKDNISFGHQNNHHELRLKEVTLDSAGHEFKVGERYQVKIATSGKEPAIGTFKVVSESEDPFLKVPEVRKQLFYIQAGWLANQGNGDEWQFEAYQKVGGMPNYSAKMVRWGLSLGKKAQQKAQQKM